MKRGNAIVLLSFLSNYEGTIITAPTTITLTIKNPSGVAVVTSQAMSLVTTGKYKNGFIYIWQSAADSPTGYYSATINSSYGGYNAVQDIAQAFNLEA